MRLKKVVQIDEGGNGSTQDGFKLVLDAKAIGQSQLPKRKCHACVGHIIQQGIPQSARGGGRRSKEEESVFGGASTNMRTQDDIHTATATDTATDTDKDADTDTDTHRHRHRHSHSHRHSHRHRHRHRHRHTQTRTHTDTDTDTQTHLETAKGRVSRRWSTGGKSSRPQQQTTSQALICLAVNAVLTCSLNFSTINAAAIIVQSYQQILHTLLARQTNKKQPKQQQNHFCFSTTMACRHWIDYFLVVSSTFSLVRACRSARL